MEEALLLDENPFSLGGLGGNNGERSDQFKRLHSLRQKWFRAKAGKTLRGEHEGIKAWKQRMKASLFRAQHMTNLVL